MQKQLSGSDRNIGKQIILGIILIAFILVAFFTFSRENYERVLAQNESYVTDATVQKARYIDKTGIDHTVSGGTAAALYDLYEALNASVEVEPMHFEGVTNNIHLEGSRRSWTDTRQSV